MNGKKVSVNYVNVKSRRKPHHLAVATTTGHQVIVMTAVQGLVRALEKVERDALRIARMGAVEDVRRDARTHVPIHVKTVVRVVLMIKIILLNMLVLVIHVKLDV